MVVYNDLFFWNPQMAIVYIVVSVAFYVIVNTEELKNKVRHPKLLGLALSLLSCFDLGLYAIVPAFAYLTVTYTLDFWVYKINKGNGEVL